MIADNPALATLYSNHMGWDIVGLISLMRSEIVQMAHLNFRDVDVKKELGIETVTTPFHDRSKQQKRPMGETLQLIVDFIAEHPGCLRSDISRGVGRAKSPTVIGYIEYLVQQKVIVREHHLRANGAVEYRYKIAN